MKPDPVNPVHPVKTPWPRVRLGEVLRVHDNSVPAAELTEVNLAGVYSFGRGLFKRGPMSPGETSYKTYNQLVADDFVISIPKAWEGAVARVTPEFDGWFLSPVFPTFRADRARLLPEFLEWYCKREPVWAELQRRSRGIGARRESVHPAQFLSLEIPLPPLSEQRRVVARIEALAAQIYEAQKLRQEAAEEAEALVSSAQSALCHPEGVDSLSIEELVGADGLRNGKSVKSAGAHSAIRCLTLSSMRKGRIDIQEVKPVPMSREEAASFRVGIGDVYVVRGNGSKDLCGRAGLVSDVAEGVVFPDLFIQVALPEKRVLPEFFVSAWNASDTRAVIEEKAKTTSGIWKINQGHILTTQVPLPSLPEQRRIVAELEALQTQVDALKRLQSETAEELDALLPAVLDRAFKGEM